jgi:hypothetical protein
VREAIKIYKSSSKHAKNAQKCSVILGKSMIKLGRIKKNNKVIEEGVEILENAAEELINLGVNNEAL